MKSIFELDIHIEIHSPSVGGGRGISQCFGSTILACIDKAPMETANKPLSRQFIL